MAGEKVAEPPAVMRRVIARMIRRWLKGATETAVRSCPCPYTDANVEDTWPPYWHPAVLVG